MKMKAFFIFCLIGFTAFGCANAPLKERSKLPSSPAGPAQPRTLPAEPLKELIVPQKEEAKKVPEKRFSISAREASVQDVLLAFSRESERNIIIDPELTGKVTVDLKQVTLPEALDSVLSPLGWTYRLDDKFIKVQRAQMETRLFTLNYIATKRSGKREIYASTGGGLQTGLATGQQGGVSTGGSRTGYSDLVSVDEMDLWKEIHKGLETIIFGTLEEKEKPPPRRGRRSGRGWMETARGSSSTNRAESSGSPIIRPT